MDKEDISLDCFHLLPIFCLGSRGWWHNGGKIFGQNNEEKVSKKRSTVGWCVGEMRKKVCRDFEKKLCKKKRLNFFVVIVVSEGVEV